LPLSADERRVFLREVCGGDEALQTEVESLLAQATAASGFLNEAALETAARQMTNAQGTLIGRQVGAYRVASLLGVGGMGEVYRARDMKLGRDVAIKVLPAMFTADRDRLLRFEREARLLAALNHPHIGAIYGLEDADGIRALVLELVEGHTLAERLAQRSARNALSISEALAIARQIADALDAAHEKGIVHRDLKPANIKITPDGVVKVLDFGLAKLAQASDSSLQSPDLSNAPTMSGGGTREGMLLGTVAYMSPEQARGKPVDKRTDIWAFGCVVYEMFAGKSPFPGDTIPDTIAAILEREPDWKALPPTTPANVRRLLAACLEKDTKRRLRDIADAASGLVVDGSAPALVDMGTDLRRSWTTSRVVLAAVAVAAFAGLIVVGMRVFPRQTAVPPPTPIRFSLLPPEGGSFFGSYETIGLAFSPDGSQLGFTASDRLGATRVWMRSLASLDARPLAGTEGATSLFWSPDGRSIGFFAAGKLKRLNISDGVSVAVCDVPTVVGLFGTWGTDGQALFASIEGQAIFRVSMSGGTPVQMVTPDPSRSETRVLWPWFLPDGRRFLYLAQLRNTEGHLMLAESGKPPREISVVASNVQYVDPGYLVFAREGALMGQRFDAVSGAVTGEPFAIAESVNYNISTFRAMFATSQSGAGAYQSHRDVYQLVWFDRGGRELGAVGLGGDLDNPRISPEGRRALFARTQPAIGSHDTWIVDLDRGVETRLTSDPTSENNGLWLRDGRSVLFALARGGPPHIVRRDLTTGQDEEMLPQGTLQGPEDVSPDGKFLVFTERTTGGENDLWTLTLTGSRIRSPLIQSPFDQIEARFSPDGRFFVFQSDESGRGEIYVMPFPVTGAKVRVSTQGGRLPRWSRDGGELFYLSADSHLVSVTVKTTPSLQIGTPAPLFEFQVGKLWRDFDVAIDGKRFLAIIPESLARNQPLTVVSNWMAEAR
jgi:Tol biopolymer transport system component